MDVELQDVVGVDEQAVVDDPPHLLLDLKLEKIQVLVEGG